MIENRNINIISDENNNKWEGTIVDKSAVDDDNLLWIIFSAGEAR